MRVGMRVYASSLGMHLRRIGFFKPLETQMKIRQKMEMLLVGVLAGAKAVSHTATTVRIDPALLRALRAAGMRAALYHC
jgi:hypothetical protein